jgi:hypothetical protein
MVGRNSMFSRPLDRRRQARGQPGWETKDESNSRQLGGISLRLACVLDSVTSLAGHGSAGVCLQSLAVRQHAHMSQTCDGMTEDRVSRLRVSRGLLFQSFAWLRGASLGSWRSWRSAYLEAESSSACRWPRSQDAHVIKTAGIEYGA